MLTCKISKLVETIWPMVVADIPVLLYGRTGVGKSTVLANDLMKKVREIFGADSMWHDYRLSTMDTTDGSGIPDIVTESDGTRVTDWTRPGMIMREDGRMHLINLDEIGHASVQLQHSIGYRFVLDRQLGKFKLPALNRIVLCTNVKEDKAGDSKLVTPFNARMAHVMVENDTDSFLQWGVEHNLDRRLLAFWKLRGAAVLHKQDDGSNAVPCERTAEMLSRVMVGNTDLGVIENCATALWGQGPAIQLVAFCRDLEAALPRLSEIKNNPDTAKVPKDVSHQYAVASAIAAQVTPADADIWAKYLARLSPDVASMAAHEAIKRHPLTQIEALSKLLID